MEELMKQLMTELQEFRSEVKEFRSEVKEKFAVVDENFVGVHEKFDGVENRFDLLEKGQEEIKAIIRHSNTLTTENLTQVRKDIREKSQNTQADVNLLFKEVESLKRQTNKIEHRLYN